MSCLLDEEKRAGHRQEDMDMCGKMAENARIQIIENVGRRIEPWCSDKLGFIGNELSSSCRIETEKEM